MAPTSSLRTQLHTQRLRLVPATAADAPRLHACWAEPQVREYLFDNQPVSPELAASLLAESLPRAKHGQGLWIVERLHEGDFIGCAGLAPLTAVAQPERHERGGLEPLVALEPAHWGKGYAREALGALVAHAFGTLDEQRLSAVCDRPNRRSHRMLEAVGFRFTREVAGPMHTLTVFMLERQAWQASGDKGPDYKVPLSA
jgi:[ribosomal protein S5]-alanine N-acetyltransferase